MTVLSQCPFCGSSTITPYGNTYSGGTRYLCESCQEVFTLTDGLIDQVNAAAQMRRQPAGLNALDRVGQFLTHLAMSSPSAQSAQTSFQGGAFFPRLRFPLLDKLNQFAWGRWLNSALVPLGWVLLVFGVYYLSRINHPDWYKHFVFQADAFLKGRLNVVLPEYYQDSIQLNGRTYSPFSIFPALVVLPFVAIWGEATDQIRISMLIGAVDAALMWILLGRLRFKGLNARDGAVDPAIVTDDRECIPGSLRVGLTLLYAFGTVHFSVSVLGTVWFFAHVVAEMGLLLALIEFFGPRRFGLIGVFISMAALSRQATLLCAVYFLLWLVLIRPPQWWRSGINFCLGMMPLFSLQFWFNWARFGQPLESGYRLINNYAPSQAERLTTKGMFDLSYLPGNLQVIFLAGPDVLPKFPFLVPNANGMSIWMTTPAYFALFAARWGRLINGLAACAVLLTCLPAIFYHATGWVQFGYRYMLDYLPVLFIPLADGLNRFPRHITWTLVVLSILVNGWGTYWVVALGW